MARNALAKLNVGPPLTVESIIPFTRLLVEHNWPLIQALSTQLVISNELSYEDVIRLIREPNLTSL